ncbi:hypothetical protein RI054_15g73180 [Pseudoscourfieldia marina]
MFRHHHIEATSTSFTSRTTRPVIRAVRIAEEERFANALRGASHSCARASKSKNCAPTAKSLNEGEMKALANNIHTGTTPPYDKKAGGGTSESLILWTHVMAILFAHRTCRANAGPSSSRPSRSSTTT